MQQQSSGENPEASEETEESLEVDQEEHEDPEEETTSNPHGSLTSSQNKLLVDANKNTTNITGPGSYIWNNGLKSFVEDILVKYASNNYETNNEDNIIVFFLANDFGIDFNINPVVVYYKEKYYKLIEEKVL